MPRKLIFEKEKDIENILETTELSSYFFIDYYEMPSGMFYELEKTFPAGSLTREQLKEELEKLYEENIPYWKNGMKNVVIVRIYAFLLDILIKIGILM